MGNNSKITFLRLSLKQNVFIKKFPFLDVGPWLADFQDIIPYVYWMWNFQVQLLSSEFDSSIVKTLKQESLWIYKEFCPLQEKCIENNNSIADKAYLLLILFHYMRWKRFENPRLAFAYVHGNFGKSAETSPEQTSPPLQPQANINRNWRSVKAPQLKLPSTWDRPAQKLSNLFRIYRYIFSQEMLVPFLSFL